MIFYRNFHIFNKILLICKIFVGVHIFFVGVYGRTLYTDRKFVRPHKCTPMGVQLCGRTNFLWAYNVRPCTPMGVLGVLGVICGRTGRTWAYKGVHGRNIAVAIFYI